MSYLRLNCNSYWKNIVRRFELFGKIIKGCVQKKPDMWRIYGETFCARNVLPYDIIDQHIYFDTFIPEDSV